MTILWLFCFVCTFKFCFKEACSRFLANCRYSPSRRTVIHLCCVGSLFRTRLIWKLTLCFNLRVFTLTVYGKVISPTHGPTFLVDPTCVFVLITFTKQQQPTYITNYIEFSYSVFGCRVCSQQAIGIIPGGADRLVLPCNCFGGVYH